MQFSCNYAASETSCANCERPFCQTNLLKSDIINCLTTVKLSKLVTINIEEPPRNEFHFENAFKIWHSTNLKENFTIKTVPNIYIFITY